jgi:ACS family hexuronate transporter-like MFS transporter
VSGEPAPALAAGARPLRWGVLALLVSATLINYIDRQTVAVLAPVLQKELHLNNQQYASIANAFLFAYAISMWAFGWVFDRVGNRAGFAIAISLWSLAAAGHSLARGLASFRLARFVLGAGESGNWPGATRSVAAWFNPRQRALAMGIVNTGAAAGPAVAAPVVWWLQDRYGWRAAFLVTGGLGLLWLVAWLMVYPAGGRQAARAPGRLPLSALLRRRQVWGIVLARFFGDPIWWLYLNWLPLYLHNARGFELKRIALSAWLPYVAADVGCVLGGSTSSLLIARGHSVNRARKTAIVIGAALMPAGMGAAFVDSPIAALACISVTLFGFQFWVGNVQTLPSDFFEVGAVGSIAGVAGTAAALGAIILNTWTGWVVDHLSYTPILVAAGVLGPLATVVLFLLVGCVRALGPGNTEISVTLTPGK